MPNNMTFREQPILMEHVFMKMDKTTFPGALPSQMWQVMLLLELLDNQDPIGIIADVTTVSENN